MTRTKTCPNCKGKGHVLDGALAACAMLLPPFGWGVLLFGNNNADSATRNNALHRMSQFLEHRPHASGRVDQEDQIEFLNDPRLGELAQLLDAS